MDEKWVMDENYEWAEIEARPPPIRPVVKTHPRKRSRKDPQDAIKGHCPCGRPSGGKNSYRRQPKYCSRYCYEFMTFPAEGYKKKTRYDFWRGTGKYAYNPPWPQLNTTCSWCDEIYSLGRAIDHANRLYCGNTCRNQAKRNPKGTSTRNGSTQIGLRVRTMQILRAFPEENLTADEIAHYYREWFRLSCSAPKIASSIKTIVNNGWANKIQHNKHEAATYQIVNITAPLKALFGETDDFGG